MSADVKVTGVRRVQSAAVPLAASQAHAPLDDASPTAGNNTRAAARPLQRTHATRLVYVPRAHAHGDDSFTYKATDCAGPLTALRLSDPATVHVHIRPVNDLPRATLAEVQMPRDRQMMRLRLREAFADEESSGTQLRVELLEPRPLGASRQSGLLSPPLTASRLPPDCIAMAICWVTRTSMIASSIDLSFAFLLAYPIAFSIAST